MNKVDLICPECGANEVNRSATSWWHFKTQKWQLVEDSDSLFYCGACGAKFAKPVKVTLPLAHWPQESVGLAALQFAAGPFLTIDLPNDWLTLRNPEQLETIKKTMVPIVAGTRPEELREMIILHALSHEKVALDNAVTMLNEYLQDIPDINIDVLEDYLTKQALPETANNVKDYVRWTFAAFIQDKREADSEKI